MGSQDRSAPFEAPRTERRHRRLAKQPRRQARAALAAALALAGSAAAAIPSPAAAVPEALPAAPPFSPELRGSLVEALAQQDEGYAPRTRHLHPDGAPLFSNRLLLEASPYLRQHAHNPVNWYPWGDEAFEAARRLGRPVLVSVGYSTCHWCHVMEEESFDDVATARVLNAKFIAVKVDREARPDVDAVYMSAAYAIAGQGGWPLNVWLTPDRKPFYAGTYFPKQDRGQRPGFVKLLGTLHEQYQEKPEEIASRADQIAKQIRADLAGSSAASSWAPSAGPLDRALEGYQAAYDSTWGGLRRRHKFPSSLHIRFLLRQHRRTGDPKALEMATHTLSRMAAGGIRDHLGGGFHRYATDVRWLVPHFEKMLYDNALLALAYTEAWQLTQNDEFRAVAREILDYVAREMTEAEGAFYSATDADSRTPLGEMEEGWFFTWTPAELEALLPASDAAAFAAYYDVRAGGNFEGRSILNTPRSLEAVAAELSLGREELLAILERSRPILYAARAERPPPLRDDKILVAWNGLMISAFARAGFAFDEAEYVERAAKAANRITRRARMRGGRLKRVTLAGRSEGPAFLEDYAFLTAGLLDLYEAGGDPRWLLTAMHLQSVQDELYADDDGGGYFRVADDGEALIVREKPDHDGAVPSGNSVSALNLLRLHAYTTRPDFLEGAGMVFAAFESTLGRRPTAVAELLLALDFHLEATREIAVLRPADDSGSGSPLFAILRRRFLPNRVLASTEIGKQQRDASRFVPWLDKKTLRAGRSTAYVCVNRVCDFPTADPKQLEEQLAGTLYRDSP